MGTIHTVWTGDAKLAIREAEKVVRKTERMEAEERRLSGTATKAADLHARVGKAVIKSKEEAIALIVQEENKQAQLSAKIKAAKDKERAQAEQVTAEKRALSEKEAAAARKSVELARQQRQAQEKLRQAARRVYDETRTPQERYAAKMRELNGLVKRGAIDQETYARAARRAGNEMRAQGKAHQGAFGATALGNLKTYAVGVLSIGTAISQVRDLFVQYRQTVDQAAQKQREARFEISSLGQLAESPQQMQALVDRVKKVYAAGGAESLGAAGKLVFALESAGASQYEDLFTKLRQTALVEQPEIMAKAAKTLQASMGEKETGTFRDLVSKAFGASKFSPALADALLEASARSGVSAGGMGISDEEVMAATSIVSAAKGSAEEAGTFLAQMFRTLKQKPEFKGMNLRQIVADIEARQMPAEEAKTWWGRAQGQEAFEIVRKNMATYQEALAEVQKAQAEDRVGLKLRLAGGIPELKAGEVADKAKAREELSRTRLGTVANITEAVIDEYVREIRSGERETELPPEASIWAYRKMAGMYRGVKGDKAFLERQQAMGAIPAKLEAEVPQFVPPSTRTAGEKFSDFLENLAKIGSHVTPREHLIPREAIEWWRAKRLEGPSVAAPLPGAVMSGAPMAVTEAPIVIQQTQQRPPQPIAFPAPTIPQAPRRNVGDEYRPNLQPGGPIYPQAAPALPIQFPAMNQAAAELNTSAQRLSAAAEKQEAAARRLEELQQAGGVEGPPMPLNNVGLRGSRR